MEIKNPFTATYIPASVKIERENGKEETLEVVGSAVVPSCDCGFEATVASNGYDRGYANTYVKVWEDYDNCLNGNSMAQFRLVFDENRKFPIGFEALIQGEGEAKSFAEILREVADAIDRQ